jgi:short-subunit dehydrogenase
MKIAIVTGSNRGIGLEYCRQLSASGYEVYAVCRSSSQELLSLENVKVFDGIDLRNNENILELTTQLEGKNVDLLVNNAGILKRDSLAEIDFKATQEQFEVNALAPLRLTHALLDFLKAGSKIVMMTSRMGSMADNESGGYYGYRMSKAALNASSVSLANDLRGKGVWVGIFHPGYVRTGMTDQQGYIDPSESVTGILKTLERLGPDTTGTFWHSNGEVLPW